MGNGKPRYRTFRRSSPWPARADEIAAMIDRRATLQAMADRYGVTREMMRLVIGQLWHGEKTTRIDDLVSARRLFPYGTLRYKKLIELIDDGVIQPESVRGPEGGRYFFSNGKAKEVRRLVEAALLHPCRLCGQSTTNTIHCQRCRKNKKAINAERYRFRLTGVVRRERPWGSAIRRKLAALDRSGDSFVGFNEALRIAGLTSMRLVYLRQKRVIHVRVDRARRLNNGCECFLYSAAEMRAIAALRE